jgi:hypothetical protein
MAPLIALHTCLAWSLEASGLPAAPSFRGCAALVHHPLALAGLLFAVYVGLWRIRNRLGNRARQSILSEPGSHGSWGDERISIIRLRAGRR